MSDIRVLEYLDPQARSHFAAWFEELNAVASAKVAGDRLVILLGGSTKQHQQQAIEAAKERWADYRRRKSSKKT